MTWWGAGALVGIGVVLGWLSVVAGVLYACRDMERDRPEDSHESS